MRPIPFLFTLPVALTLAAAAPGAAAASEARLGVELNKLETFEGGCRSFFLFRNRAGTAFTGFELGLAILDTEGVIDRLLTIDAAPLPAARTTLKIFEIEGIACDRIGEIVLHDIPVCTAEDGPRGDCFGLVELGSRAPVALVP